jgi:DNA-binding response OmpR family regulator
MIINDYAPLRDLLQVNLKARGFEVREMVSKTGLFEAVTKNSPDLVIMDLMLDEVDGFSLCRQACQSGSSAVIVINLRAGENDLLRCLEMGVDDYISKPFGVDELMARINAALRHHRKIFPVEPVQV